MKALSGGTVFFAMALCFTQAEPAPQELVPLPLTNSAQTEKALGTAAQTMHHSSAALVLGKKGPQAAVTFVRKDGVFVTKASEVPRLGDCLLTRDGTTFWTVREVRRDKETDLAMGQVIANDAGLPEIEPVRWAPAGPLRLGTWLVAPALEFEPGRQTLAAQPLKLGVLSAQTRQIESQGSALGITMEAGSSGVSIKKVVDDSPAQRAGLRPNDLLIQIDGATVKKEQEVIALVKSKQPGDELVLTLKRHGNDLQKTVRVASRSRMLSNLFGDDYANGGVSIRTDGFEQVLQHDLPLNPIDMGGPLFNLSGETVGVNIARADRITTYALPMESFRVKIEQWLESLH